MNLMHRILSEPKPLIPEDKDSGFFRELHQYLDRIFELLGELRPARITAENVLVLVNNTDISRSVADYYIAQRDVPAANRLDVDFRVTRNTNTVWPFPTWEEQEALWDEIDAYITAQGLDIRCILLMPDFSVSAVNKDAWGELVPTSSQNRITLDSWLCHRSRGFPLRADDLYWQYNPWYVWLHEGQTALQHGEDSLETEKIEHYTQARQATMGLTDGVQEPDPDVRGMILTMRLDGPSEALIKGMIDNAIAAEGKQLPGTWYFDYDALETLGEFHFTQQNTYWPLAEAIGKGLGRAVTTEKTSARLWDFDDAGFYIGWRTFAPPYPVPSNRTWKAGAIGFEPCMWSLLFGGPPRQMGLWSEYSYIGKMITEGITATFGETSELWGGRFIRVSELLGLLRAGLNWAEAYWAQMYLSQSCMTAIGDPLYRPFLN